jgi:hypothetical protein
MRRAKSNEWREGIITSESAIWPCRLNEFIVCVHAGEMIPALKVMATGTRTCGLRWSRVAGWLKGGPSAIRVLPSTLIATPS